MNKDNKQLVPLTPLYVNNRVLSDEVITRWIENVIVILVLMQVDGGWATSLNNSTHHPQVVKAVITRVL